MKNILTKIIPLIVIAVVLNFSGCARVGYDFNEQNVRSIQIGKTTQSDIVSMFGNPWRKGIQDGVMMWTYGRYTYKVIGNTDAKDLVIEFDKDGKVSSYTYNSTLGRD